MNGDAIRFELGRHIIDDLVELTISYLCVELQSHRQLRLSRETLLLKDMISTRPDELTILDAYKARVKVISTAAGTEGKVIAEWGLLSLGLFQHAFPVAITQLSEQEIAVLDKIYGYVYVFSNTPDNSCEGHVHQAWR